MSRVIPFATPEFRGTVVHVPEPFDLEQEDPIAFYRGLWSALKIMAVFWSAAIAAVIYWCR